MLLFDKSKFDRQRKLYNLDEIKIREEKEREEDVDGQDNGNGTDGTDGTDGTHSGGVSKDSNHSDSPGNEGNRDESNENYEETETESNNSDDDSSADTSIYSHNVSHVSHVSQVKAPSSPINSNSSKSIQVNLKPYKPPTGKNALDVWNIASWANNKMGHCRLCQEIGEENPTRSQDRDRMFEHTYKRHKKNGWLYEVLRVEDNNTVDVYHIGNGAYSLSSLWASEKLKARELKGRQTYWKAHAAPRDKIEETKKRATELQERRKIINEKRSKLPPEQQKALAEYEASTLLSGLM